MRVYNTDVCSFVKKYIHSDISLTVVVLLLWLFI